MDCILKVSKLELFYSINKMVFIEPNTRTLNTEHEISFN